MQKVIDIFSSVPWDHPYALVTFCLYFGLCFVSYYFPVFELYISLPGLSSKLVMIMCNILLQTCYMIPIPMILYCINSSRGKIMLMTMISCEILILTFIFLSSVTYSIGLIFYAVGVLRNVDWILPIGGAVLVTIFVIGILIWLCVREIMNKKPEPVQLQEHNSHYVRALE